MFPKDLVRPCILAGCPKGGVVLDPFAGSGTVGQVAEELGRGAVLIELNPVYVKMQQTRIEVQSSVAARGAKSGQEAKGETGWLF